MLTGWRLNESPFALSEEVAKLLAGGVFVDRVVNGHDTIDISAGVTWSLRWEWTFYAGLLVTSLFARRLISGAQLPVMGLLVSIPLLLLFPGTLRFGCMLTFFVGMTAASAKHTIFVQPIKALRLARSIAVVGCLAVVLLAFDTVYTALSILILGLAFWFVVSGTTVFGLLVTRPAKRLGDISYGIYLLQGPVLFLAFSSPFVRSFDQASAWGHWVTVLISAISLVFFATLTHDLTERPGIVAGQRVCARLLWRRAEQGVSSQCV